MDWEPGAELKYQSLAYRAPEVHFGCRDFNAKIDSWSLGLVFLACTGHGLWENLAGGHPQDEAQVVYLLVGWLGPPPAVYDSSPRRALFPLAHAGQGAGGGAEFLVAPARLLGVLGSDLVVKFLQWDARSRWRVAAATAHPFFHPNLFQPTGGLRMLKAPAPEDSGKDVVPGSAEPPRPKTTLTPPTRAARGARRSASREAGNSAPKRPQGKAGKARASKAGRSKAASRPRAGKHINAAVRPRAGKRSQGAVRSKVVAPRRPPATTASGSRREFARPELPHKACARVPIEPCTLEPREWQEPAGGYGRLVPDLCPTEGLTVQALFGGMRHSWVVRAGVFAAEVVEYVRNDPCLMPGTPEWAALGVAFLPKGEPPRKPKAGAKKARARAQTKTEQGYKWSMGAKAPEGSSSNMCGLVLKPFPARRVLALRTAFLEANAAAFEAVVAHAKAQAQREAEPDWNQNWTDFRDLPWRRWMLSCLELQLARQGGSPRKEKFVNEPRHNDGCMSILHAALTLYGRRDVRFEQGGGEPDIFLHNLPGSFYLGNVTGATHQVHHCATPPHEYLMVDGEALSVNVQFRTSLFAHAKARLRDTTGSPTARPFE